MRIALAGLLALAVIAVPAAQASACPSEAEAALPAKCGCCEAGNCHCCGETESSPSRMDGHCACVKNGPLSEAPSVDLRVSVAGAVAALVAPWQPDAALERGWAHASRECRRFLRLQVGLPLLI